MDCLSNRISKIGGRILEEEAQTVRQQLIPLVFRVVRIIAVEVFLK